MSALIAHRRKSSVKFVWFWIFYAWPKLWRHQLLC